MPVHADIIDKQVAQPSDHIGAPVGSFDIAANGMCERHLSHFTQIAGALCRPVSQVRAEAVWHCRAM